MSEEKENSAPEEQPITPKETPAAPKPIKKPVTGKAAFSTFINKHNKFNSPKAGNSSRKGAAFKGGGVKKGN